MKKTGGELFSQAQGQHMPLAARMRPRTLDEYVGQDHILGPGRLLRRAIKADQLSSIILSGPPGTGKTTLATVVANTTSSSFQSINAVLNGVNELRAAIDEAKTQKELYARRTILFVDEVHRWNKAQQDALLPWVENGTIILIGATTENPWFEVNPALVSRSRVFQLVSLTETDMDRILNQALQDPVRGYGNFKVELTPEARRHLVRTSSGDARTLLNALELAVESGPDSFPPPPGTLIPVDLACAEDSIQSKAILYDPDGDYHFDTISAFIKSIRGSDPDAALYWLARMVKGGESPRFIFRRLLVHSAEDIGLADPAALSRVQAAAEAFERVGMPEGQYFLAQATLDLCLCPKSNSLLAYFDALKTVQEEPGDVPDHLKDANRDGPALGHGKNYKYPHAWNEHWVAQQYLPHNLHGKLFYQPGYLGWEGEKAPGILERRSLQLAQAELHQDQEVRSASPADKSFGHFVQRSSQSLDPLLGGLKDRLCALLNPLPHHRIAVAGDDAYFLVPALMALVPDGSITCLSGESARQRYVQLLESLDKSRSSRLLAPGAWTCLGWDALAASAVSGQDGLPARGPDEGQPEGGASFRLLEQQPEAVKNLVAFLGRQPDLPRPWIFAELLVSKAPGLSVLLPPALISHGWGPKLVQAEADFARDCQGREDYGGMLARAGWKVEQSEVLELSRKRMVSPAQLEAWLADRPGTLGSFIAARLDDHEQAGLKAALGEHCLNREISRPGFFALVQARPAV